MGSIFVYAIFIYLLPLREILKTYDKVLVELSKKWYTLRKQNLEFTKIFETFVEKLFFQWKYFSERQFLLFCGRTGLGQSRLSRLKKTYSLGVTKTQSAWLQSLKKLSLSQACHRDKIPSDRFFVGLKEFLKFHSHASPK